jgi:Bifunctional DNA primase/polymerase, N-terminal
MVTKRGLDWITAAAEDPALCRSVWADDPRRPYLLPTGRLFDVVVIAQRVGMETFDQLRRRRMPLGPVMADWGSQELGFLLPMDSRERFARLVATETADPPPYRYLDKNAYVVVPGPEALSGDRCGWLLAPRRKCVESPERTAALAVMFVAAASLVERAERYGEETRRPAAAAANADKSDGR